jgi:hypothetical protein
MVTQIDRSQQKVHLPPRPKEAKTFVKVTLAVNLVVWLMITSLMTFLDGTAAVDSQQRR